MIAATGPSFEPLPSSTISISDANRIVAIVMPETGLFDEPTRPAMYADTEQNRKPATIITIVIGIETATLLHDRLIQHGERQREHHEPDQHRLHRHVFFGLVDHLGRAGARRCEAAAHARQER